jgi:hypothetical protein
MTPERGIWLLSERAAYRTCGSEIQPPCVIVSGVYDRSTEPGARSLGAKALGFPFGSFAAGAGCANVASVAAALGRRNGWDDNEYSSSDGKNESIHGRLPEWNHLPCPVCASVKTRSTHCAAINKLSPSR